MKVAPWLVKAFAVYMAAAAAFATVLLGLAVSDEISSGFNRIFDSGLRASPGLTLLVLIILTILSVGIVAVVVDEVFGVYRKWSTRVVQVFEKNAHPTAVQTTPKAGRWTSARAKFLLKQFFDLRLPRDEATATFGFETREQYDALRNFLTRRIEDLARKRDNASTLVIVTSLAGAALLVGIGTSCEGCKSQPQLIGLIAGLGAVLIAAGAQLLLALRARVDGMIATAQRRLDSMAKQGRVRLLGGRSRWFPQGAYHAGYLTNVGSEPCIVLLPGTVYALADDAIYKRDCWAMPASAEAELIPAVTHIPTSKAWNATTVGPERPVKLAPGDSLLVGFGMMWGAKDPNAVKLEAAFPVIEGYGDWVSVTLPKALKESPDNGKLQLEWTRINASQPSTKASFFDQ